MGQPSATDAIETPEFFARLAKCDRDAVGQLYRAHHKLMVGYLAKKKRLHGVPEPEWLEVVQDVFVKFLEHPPDLDPARKIGPLLLTMALNKARDRGEKARRLAANEVRVGKDRLRTAAGAEAVDARLVAADRVTLVEGKLQNMEPSDRQALTAFVESENNDHVAALAAAAGVTRGAAQMRFLRAKDRWATELNKDDKERGST